MCNYPRPTNESEILQHLSHGYYGALPWNPHIAFNLILALAALWESLS